MELVKNIFFNTDKLTVNSSVKISYTGKFFQDNSEKVFIHFGFGNAWENLSDEVILKIIEESNIEKFGVRSVISKIETIMLRSIHKHGLVNFTGPDNLNENTNTN